MQSVSGGRLRSEQLSSDFSTTHLCDILLCSLTPNVAQVDFIFNSYCFPSVPLYIWTFLSALEGSFISPEKERKKRDGGTEEFRAFVAEIEAVMFPVSSTRLSHRQV